MMQQEIWHARMNSNFDKFLRSTNLNARSMEGLGAKLRCGTGNSRPIRDRGVKKYQVKEGERSFYWEIKQQSSEMRFSQQRKKICMYLDIQADGVNRPKVAVRERILIRERIGIPTGHCRLWAVYL